MPYRQQTPASYSLSYMCQLLGSVVCVLCLARNRVRLLQVLSFILSHTTDGAGAAVLDAALSTELSPLKAKVSRPLLLAPIVGVLKNFDSSSCPDRTLRLCGACHRPSALCAWVLTEVSAVAVTGILTTLDAWGEANPGGSSAGGAQQLSVLHELAASEMCPMRALEYAASLDWSSAKPSLGAIDPARVAHFQTFVQQVKVRQPQQQHCVCDGCDSPGSCAAWLKVMQRMLPTYHVLLGSLCKLLFVHT